MNKGYTEAQAYEQINKIREAGMTYDLFLMMGVAGSGNGLINAEKSVKFANETQPYMVSVMATSVIEGLELEDTYFFGSHNYNLAPFSGDLKTKKHHMISHIDKKIREKDPAILNGIKMRNPI